MEFSWHQIPVPWGVIVSLAIVAIAFLIRNFFEEIIEDDHHFKIIIAFFLAIYIAAAFLVGSLNPITIAHTAINRDGSEIVSSN